MKKIGFLFLAILFSFTSMAWADGLTTILDNLNSSNPDTRREAIRTLKGSAYRSRSEVVSPLLNALRTDTDSINREYAAEALVKHTSPSARQSVIDTFTDPRYRNSHEAAAESLRRVNSPAVKEAFLNNTQHPNQYVRMAVAKGLGTFITDPQVVTKLVEMINSDSFSIAREYAAESIAILPAAQSVPVLAAILSDPNSRGKVAAVDGLRRRQSSLSIPPLLGVLSSTNVELRRSAIRGLANFALNATVFEALYNAVKTETNEYAKELLIEAIVKSNDPRALEIARANMTSRNYSIQRSTLEKIKKSGDKTDLTVLIGLLQDNDESLRSKAYDAIKAIISRLKKDDPFKTRLVQCLPGVSYSPYSDSTRHAAFYMDVFLGGFGLYSAAASGNKRTVARLSPESVQALQALVRELLEGEDIYSDLN